MDPKVIILGSTGFIGGALLDALQQRRGFRVEGYNSSALDLISRDCVERLRRVVDAETILIVAARSRQRRDRVESFSEDIAIAANVARLLSQQRVRKCVYFSTISVYGDGATDLAITEETAIAPTSLYGVAKFAGECVVRQVAEEAGIPLVVLRPCKLYGPGDTSHAYGPVGFIESIVREEKVWLFGDGTELRDHLFVRDLAEIVIRFLSGDGGGTYNVATGRSNSFTQIVACLRGVAGKDFEVIHVQRDRPKIDQRINPAKLVGALPGLCFTDLERGLFETYKYFVARGVSNYAVWRPDGPEANRTFGSGSTVSIE